VGVLQHHQLLMPIYNIKDSLKKHLTLSHVDPTLGVLSNWGVENDQS
jgi:hypothetical protein